MTALMNRSPNLTFDDVLIKPRYSDIESRDDIDLSTSFLGYDLKLPIISANMDYVTGYDMAVTMWDQGGFYIHHRFIDFEVLSDYIDSLYMSGYPISVSIGTRDPELEFKKATILQKWITHDLTITVDVAHGHHKKVGDMVKRLKDAGFPRVIAGNVATAQGYDFLQLAGADAVKVGIGPGSVCTTREVTGIGVPQLSAIRDCLMYQGERSPAIIADGGVKNSGDIVKALAAGADMVMLGSLLAGTNEAPGEVRVDPEGNRWKPYRGQSIFGVNETKFTPEGVSGWVKEKGPVADVLKRLAGGIRSGMSYVGARNLTELREKAEFVLVSPSTHLESGTRVSL